MHQQTKVKEADKIIKDKYDLNETMSIIWGFHCMLVEEPGLLDCSNMWLGNTFSVFQRKVLFFSLRLWVNSQTNNPEDKVSTKIRNYSNHMAQIQKTLFLDMKTSLQLMKYFKHNTSHTREFQFQLECSSNNNDYCGTQIGVHLSYNSNTAFYEHDSDTGSLSIIWWKKEGKGTLFVRLEKTDLL
jgi:hypothetical protein